MCSSRVAESFTEIIQHIHSLRAKGVKLSHIASACGMDIKTFRKSRGVLCTVPCEIFFVIKLILPGLKKFFINSADF
jgi:hypothetical protein